MDSRINNNPCKTQTANSPNRICSERRFVAQYFPIMYCNFRLKTPENPSQELPPLSAWPCLQILEVPRVRLSISGVKPGTNPETPWKRSQSKFWISRFRTVGDPETLENKGDSLPRLISELCYPQYGWYPFLFWKGPLHGTSRAGHEIPNSTGGTSEDSRCEKNGKCVWNCRWKTAKKCRWKTFRQLNRAWNSSGLKFFGGASGFFSSSFSFHFWFHIPGHIHSALIERGEKPRSNKRCFLNGVFQSGVFRGWPGSARAIGTKMPENTGVFGHSFVFGKGLPVSQAEVRNLKNTIWKTPFGTLREKTPTPKISALLRKRPVLLRANFVLTKDRKRPYDEHFCGKLHREGSCSIKRPGVLSKVQMLNLVLRVGVFSLLPN